MKETRQVNESGVRMFHIMQDVGLANDTEICQYLALDYLKAILKTDEYYVKRKRFFVDKREKTVPFRIRFELTPYGQLLTPEQIRRMDERNKTIQYFEKESSSLLTSCWTERTTENALMWDRDGERHKVCIKTTVGDFVAAFGNTKFEIWCGKVIYEPINPVLMSEDIIWYKEPYFSDEREVRFYFSTEFGKIVSDKENNEGVPFEVNKKLLIHEIVLSPYINKNAAEELEQSISKTYGIKTTISKIEVR